MFEPLGIFILIILGCGLIAAFKRIKSLEKTVQLLQSTMSVALQQRPVQKDRQETSPPKDLPRMQIPVERARPPVPQPSIPKVSEPSTPWSPSSPTAMDQMMAKGFAWVTQNWLFAAAALLLALSGIFLVIYSIETGLLTPFMRILGALALGGVFIASGEKLRRQDNAERHGLLPSVLSSSGLVILYGAVIAAQSLYGLINDVQSFIGLILVSVLSLFLGGRHKTFHSLFGLVGAAMAPYLVGGETSSPLILPTHYLLLIGAGLALAWHRQKPILGTIALGLATLLAPFPIFIMVEMENHSSLIAITFQTALLAATLFFAYTHPKAPETIITNMKGKKALWRPSRLSLSIALLLLIPQHFLFFGAFTVDNTYAVAMMAMIGVAALLAIRSHTSKTLNDLPLWSLALATPLALFLFDIREISLPVISGILAVGTAIIASLALHPRLKTWQTPVSFIGALYPVAGALIVQSDLFYRPHISELWPYLLMAGAAGLLALTALAGKLKSVIPMGFYAIATLALIAHSLSTLLDDAALSLALSALLIAAAFIDGRLKLPYVHYALCLGIGGLLGRLLAYPGVDWLLKTEWLYMLVSLGAAITAFTLLSLTGSSQTRKPVREAAMSGLALLVPTTLCLITLRGLTDNGLYNGNEHWVTPLLCLSFLLSGISLLTPVMTTIMEKTRTYLGIFIIGSSMAALALMTLLYAPLVNSHQTILGIVVLNSLILAYLIPAGLITGLLLHAPKVKSLLTDKARLGGLGASIALVLLYLYTNVRFFWHGTDMDRPFIFAGENATYTVLTVAIGFIVTFASLKTPLALQSAIRRAGLAIVAIAIGKAIFIDASEIDGIARVLSFLIMGLVLAGMAWLDKQLGYKTEDDAS